MSSALNVWGWADRMHRGVKNAYQYEKEMVLHTLELSPRRIVVTPNMAYFHYVYTSGINRTLPFKSYLDIPPDSLQQGDMLLLPVQLKYFNPSFIYAPGKVTHIPPPDYALHPEEYGFLLLRENGTNRLYEKQ